MHHEDWLVSMSGISVLIADDDSRTRAVLADELRKCFFVHEPLADGAQLLDAALTCQVDVIVSDLCMPKLTGLDVMCALRARGVGAPFVIVSSTREVAEDCIALGAAAFVWKADVTRELVPAVRAAIAGRGEPRVPAESA
jgi:CheY-like chemotaxis protein